MSDGDAGGSSNAPAGSRADAHTILREKIKARMCSSGTELQAPASTALVNLSSGGLRGLDTRLSKTLASRSAMDEVDVILGDIDNILNGLNKTLRERRVRADEFALFAKEVIRRSCEAENKARLGGIWSTRSAEFEHVVKTKVWGQWLDLLKAMIRNYVFVGYKYSQPWKSMVSMKIEEKLRFCRIVKGELVFKDDITSLGIFLTLIKKEKRYDNLYTIFSQMLNLMIQQLGVQVPDLYRERNEKREEFPALKKYNTKPRGNCAATDECGNLLRSVGGGAETL